MEKISELFFVSISHFVTRRSTPHQFSTSNTSSNIRAYIPATYILLRSNTPHHYPHFWIWNSARPATTPLFFTPPIASAVGIGTAHLNTTSSPNIHTSPLPHHPSHGYHVAPPQATKTAWTTTFTTTAITTTRIAPPCQTPLSSNHKPTEPPPPPLSYNNPNTIGKD